MGKTITVRSSEPVKKSRPALTPESRQNQIVAKALNLVEKQIDEGTASSQVLTHFIKLGTVQAQLELEKLRNETEMIKAKTKALESQKHSEELMEKAIAAFRLYNGHGSDDDDEIL